MKYCLCAGYFSYHIHLSSLKPSQVLVMQYARTHLYIITFKITPVQFPKSGKQLLWNWTFSWQKALLSQHLVFKIWITHKSQQKVRHMKYCIHISGPIRLQKQKRVPLIYELPLLKSNPLPRNYKNYTYLESIHRKSVNRNSIQEQILRKINLRLNSHILS